MLEQGVYIRDVSSLEELNNVFEYTGESMATIEENVSGYINGVKDVLEHQLDAIREQLERAQQELNEAEADLSACESSQEWDEEDECYRPSCNCEMSAVNAARREVEEWQQKYDKGKDIVDQCQREIDDYNAPGGLLFPPGGHCLIENMCDQQTPNITEQLREHIEGVVDILQSEVGVEVASDDIQTNPHVKESDQARSQRDRFAAFKAAAVSVKQEQAIASELNHIQDANRAMRCPSCGMPLALCTCRNLHRDINLYH